MSGAAHGSGDPRAFGLRAGKRCGSPSSQRRRHGT
jgi:hypothetical protein